MHEYEVIYLSGNNYKTVNVNAVSVPAALTGTQRMLNDEGLSVKVVSATKIHRDPNPRSATVIA